MRLASLLVAMVALLEIPVSTERGAPIWGPLPYRLYLVGGTEMADRFGGRRMAKHWHVIAGVSLSFTVDVTGLGGGLALDGPWTAIRMLGEYTIGPDAAPAAGDQCTIGVGIGVVSSDAFAVGSTAMPDPVGEPEYPWLYWAEHDFHFVDTSLA